MIVIIYKECYSSNDKFNNKSKGVFMIVKRFLLFILVSILLIVFIPKNNYIMIEDNVKEDSIIIDNNSVEMNTEDVEVAVIDKVEVTTIEEVEATVADETEAVFTHKSLTSDIIVKIMDSSYKENDEVKIEDLSYVQVTYWGFDDQEHTGELIVNKKIAEDIVEIFCILYEAKFPIEKIELIDEYGADDNLSMSANNTSAFNYREVVGSKGKLSKHSYGMAVDINPVQNPYIKNEVILPESATDFLDRTNIKKGMIVEGDVCYNAFKKRGWTWGGEWNSLKDYQHFEKR